VSSSESNESVTQVPIRKKRFCDDHQIKALKLSYTTGYRGPGAMKNCVTQIHFSPDALLELLVGWWQTVVSERVQ